MGLSTHNFDTELSIWAKVHRIHNSHPGKVLLDGREVCLEKLHGNLSDTFEPIARKRKIKPPENRPRSADCLVHRNAEFAQAHAERLERLTGDHCEVRKYGPTLFKVIRYDASGKWVLNCSY